MRARFTRLYGRGPLSDGLLPSNAEGRAFLSATVKEAVADAQGEISQEETTEARSRATRPRTGKDGSAEHADVGQRPANLRPRDSRVRHLVLFGAPPRVQPHRRAPVPDSPRTTWVCTCHDQPSARCGLRRRV